MHEAGIAAAIATEIRARDLDPSSLRLVVSGGHGDEVAFDAALRAHLGAVAPGVGLETLAIEHAPVPRICARCTTPFEAPFAADPCPACGGPGVAVPTPERVELEWTSPDAGPDRADQRTGAVAVRESPHPAHEHRDPGLDVATHEGPDGGSADDAWPSTTEPGDGTLGA